MIFQVIQSPVQLVGRAGKFEQYTQSQSPADDGAEQLDDAHEDEQQQRRLSRSRQ